MNEDFDVSAIFVFGGIKTQIPKIHLKLKDGKEATGVAVFIGYKSFVLGAPIDNPNSSDGWVE